VNQKVVGPLQARQTHREWQTIGDVDVDRREMRRRRFKEEATSNFPWSFVAMIWINSAHAYVS